jgi:spore maturation protein CgeB
MKIALFCHSLRSDWNHGNAHFLRGVVTELTRRGHTVHVFEPRNAWSFVNQAREDPHVLERLHAAYPLLRTEPYDPAHPELERRLEDMDLVLVHEWNDHALVARIGHHRAHHGGYRLLFHDTHHRSVSEPHSIDRYDLSHYDGVLAFGAALRERYLEHGWAERVWVWHEAADPRVFRPLAYDEGERRELVWIGNWGDDERTSELHEFLFDPAAALKLRCRVHGVRYPESAQAELARMGIEYAGWIANFDVPAAFAAHRVTVHVPRRPYLDQLPGIPTIRPFEALACGIPLVMALWEDTEHLFRPGVDYLQARDGIAMRRHLRDVLGDAALAGSLARHGRETILARHTCAHRVDEILAIAAEIGCQGIETRSPSVPPRRHAKT